MRTHRHRIVLTAVLVAAPVFAAAARSQTAPGPVFRQVIPQPTGKNGYEELVAAAELVKSSERFQRVDAEPSSATLSIKRRVLQDRPIVQALSLLRQGLQKPVFEPRESVDVNTLLPEFVLFRPVGRLLALQHYVLMADGKTSEAIENTALTLALGRALQTSTLLGGTVGTSIDALALNTAGDSLDQLSAADCEKLFRICLSRLAQPDPLLRLMESERRLVSGSVPDQIRKQGAGSLAELIAGSHAHADDAARAKLLAGEAQQAGTSAQAREQLASGVAREFGAFYDQARAELARPAWLRTFPDPGAADGSLAARLAGALVPALKRVSDVYTRDEAQVRLLACHCAIRRYRWEFGRWPASLDELGLGDLAIDPFSGKPLNYVLHDGRYRLTSIGGAAPADDPKAVNGRLPVSITSAD